MEHKTFPAMVTKTDDSQGIVETIFAVFGNIDDGDDVIHPGAFTKTFSERGSKVLVLDMHRTDSIMSAIGKPLEFRELVREQLPSGLLTDAPDASGGAYAKVQFLMDTPEGKGAFIRLRDKAVSEWSFGYDALDVDYSKANKDDEEVTVRNLRTLKLYEISPVLWGMNPATMTASAKAAPSEGKPYRAVREGNRWAVYKLDEDGEPTGKPLGTHDTEEEAQAQVRALYAQEDDGDKGVEPVPDPMPDWAQPIWQAARDNDEDAFNHFMQELDNAPQTEAAQDKQEPEKAGPDAESEPPTSEDVLQLIQLEELEMSLMEV